jgi:hypothetical protein
MTSRTLWIKSVFILALLVAAPAATAGQTVSVFRQKGNTATATFLATDPNDSCLINFVSVTGSDLIEKVLAGGGIQVLRIVLDVVLFDACTDTVLFAGGGGTNVSNLLVAQDLNSARLTATVTIQDALTGSFSTFEVNLTWRATSEPTLTVFKDNFKDKELGINIKVRSRSTMTEAVAEGTVVGSVCTLDICGLSRNVTPELSDSASIHRFNDATREVTKGP